MQFLLTKSLGLRVKVKYGDYFSEPDDYFLGFPYANNSYIKPLAKNPLFGSFKWDLEPFQYSSAGQPIYLTYNEFHLILGGNMVFRPYMNQFDSDNTQHTITNLPHLPLEKEYIVSRYPLSQAASFNPLLPLDFWSWLFSIFAFSAMAILIIFSHITLRPTQGSIINSLYYCTDYWRDFTWFKSNSVLLSLWAISFFLINNAYQIDFRTGLISQTLEDEVNSWNDVDMFNIHIHTFYSFKDSPVNRIGFFIHKNLIESDRFYYRYPICT